MNHHIPRSEAVKRDISAGVKTPSQWDEDSLNQSRGMLDGIKAGRSRVGFHTWEKKNSMVAEENELKYSGEVGRSGASENVGLIKMFEQKYKWLIKTLPSCPGLFKY